MIALGETEALHARLGTAAQLADYLCALAEIGVVRFESFLVDGHTVFVAKDGQTVAMAGSSETALWDLSAEDGPQQSGAFTNPGPVSSIVFSRDGRKLVWASNRGAAGMSD